MSQKIQWGILGTGSIAHKFATGLSFLSDAELVSVGSRNTERANQFADGFDIFTKGRGPLCTPEMGGDYQGYQAGDFPITEEVCSRLIFLPVFSNPVEGAAERVVATIRKVVAHAEQLAVKD